MHAVLMMIATATVLFAQNARAQSDLDVNQELEQQIQRDEIGEILRLDESQEGEWAGHLDTHTPAVNRSPAVLGPAIEERTSSANEFTDQVSSQPTEPQR